MTTGAEYSKLVQKALECVRCGGMYYDPKTMIEDYRQRAAEWEEVAMDTARELAEALAQNAQLREALTGVPSTATQVLPTTNPPPPDTI